MNFAPYRALALLFSIAFLFGVESTSRAVPPPEKDPAPDRADPVKAEAAAAKVGPGGEVTDEEKLKKMLLEVQEAARAAGDRKDAAAQERLKAAIEKLRAEATKVAEAKGKKEPMKAPPEAADAVKENLAKLVIEADAKRVAGVKAAVPAKPNVPGPPQGASFHVDPEAGQLLRRAREFLEDGRHDFSVEVWRRVLRDYGSTLTTRKEWVQKGPLSKGDYRLYHRLRGDVEREIAEQDLRVLKSFRIHADAEAKGILSEKEGPGREVALTRVVDQYFLSEFGDDAAYELACIRMERWEFEAALDLFRLIREVHPDPSIPEGEILLRSSVALAAIGEFDSAEKVVSSLAATGGDGALLSAPAVRAVDAFVKGRIESGEVLGDSTLVHLPDTEISPAPDALDEGLSEGWNVGPRPPAGAPSGKPTTLNRGTTTIRAGGAVVVNGVVVSNGANQDAAMLQNWRAQKLRPATRIEISEGRAYIMIDGRLHCVDASSGKLLWRGLKPEEPNPSNPKHALLIRLRANGLHLFHNLLDHQVGVIGDTVYALENFLPKDTPPAGGVVINRVHPGQREGNFLAAYDAVTGKERWRRRPMKTSNDKKAIPVDAATFLSKPIAHRSRLLVPISEDGRLSLLALDPQDGEILWSEFLCQEPGNATKTGSPVAVAAEGDDIFLNSGSGALFCLDAHTGRVRWGLRYPRSGTQAQHWSTPSKVGGFDDNIVRIDGSRVVVIPPDFDYAFAISRTGGEVLWEISKGTSTAVTSYAIAATAVRIYLGGPDSISAYNAADGKQVWNRPLPDTSFGRALLAGESIYVPHEGRIRRINATTGKIEKEQWAVFPEPTPVGNLATDGHRLLAGGMRRGYSLSPLEDAMRALAQRIEEGDPGAYQARMRLYIQKGEVKKAVADLVGLTETLREQKDYEEAGSRFFDGLEELELASRPDSLDLVLDLVAEEAGAASVAKIDQKVADSLTERRYSIFRQTLDLVAEKGGSDVESVLSVAPYLNREDMLYLGRRAIAKVAKADSGEKLEAALVGGGRPAVVAMAALVKLRGEAAVVEVSDAMRGGDDHTRLYAAAELLNFDRPEALEEIVSLLSSEDKTVRRLAGGWLRHLTAGEIIYYADAPDSVRGESLKVIQQWATEGPALSELALPFDLRPQFAGRILAVSYDNTRRISIVSELQPDGNHVEIVRTPITQRIMDVEGLPNGNVLGIAYNKITEFDISGKPVWNLDLPTNQRVVKAARLPNGNTLAMDYRGVVREYDRASKKVAKTWRKTGQSGDKFSLLGNGNILVFSTRRKDVVEIDPTGKEVRATEIPGLPAGKAAGTYITAAAMNADGVIVVSDVRKRRLLAFDSTTGRELWTADSINYARAIQPLPGGNFLVVQSNAIHEVDGQGKELEGTKISGTFYGAHKF